MIVVDASAILAILFDEPERAQFISLIGLNPGSLMSAVGLLECAMVIAGRRPADLDRWRSLESFLNASALHIAAFDHEQVLHARDAFLRFGKGRHPAALNMGDCAAYALARSRNLPLLFKGGDFALTDVEPASRD